MEEGKMNLFIHGTTGRHKSHLVGEIRASYHGLINIFGEPDYRAEKKGENSAVEWHLNFFDGTFASIYDWKTSDVYDPEMLPVEDVDEWNIGGATEWAAFLVRLTILADNDPRRAIAVIFEQGSNLK